VIHLYSPCDDIRSDRSRVQVSSGIRLATSDEDKGVVPYRKGAWVPCEPWRSLNSDERECIWAREWPDHQCAVGLIVVPGVEDLRRIREECVVRDREYANRVDTAAKTLLAGARLVTSLEEPILTGIAEHPPNLTTVTVTGDGKNCQRIGLHVDTWQTAAIDRRHLSPGRLCVNVGRADRWFIFVPYTLDQIAARMALAGCGTNNYLVNRLVESYLSSHTDSPVYRLRIHPGEAYVAPTDNMIHDGSSLAATEISLCYTYRGRFAIGTPRSG
jgi:hypothetical protein